MIGHRETDLRAPARRQPVLTAAWLLVLAGALALILTLNLPGHLSVDSLISLAEGRTGQRITWGPPMYSAILGFFDSLRPGTTLYVAASVLLLLGSWAALPALRTRIFWTGPLVLVLAIALPQVVIYQGIVWKDVLFANVTIAAFVALAFTLRRWSAPPVRYGGLLLTCLLLALAALLRQNGFISWLMLAIVLGWAVGRASGWARGLAWGAGGLAATFALMLVLDAATPVREKPQAEDLDVGVRLVQQYDLAGALAWDPARPMPHLERDRPDVLAIYRQEAPKIYTPIRSDAMMRSQALGRTIWRLDADAVAAQWRDTILTDPAGYAARRFEVFRWVFAPPVIDYCLPVFTGANGLPEQMDLLGIEPRMTRGDQRLYNYATWYFDTPVYSHLTFAIIALAVGLFLLWRRGPADLAMAGLMASAGAFAASFFVISIACDYRYLYFLDLAAITGLLYVALDPRTPKRRT